MVSSVLSKIDGAVLKISFPKDNWTTSLRGGSSFGQKDVNDSKHDQREQLFEAYNMLHSLAQGFQKPFDYPAIVVVGHQSSGKSALIEALIGFQFNQVGGGTKTRRPIQLNMSYNKDCERPRCFLVLENGSEEERSLNEIQDYIESENKRLERDSSKSFDSKEIIIKIEYKNSPNMILIDTPGLIQAPDGKYLNMHQKAIYKASKEAEELVLEKMRKVEHTILCVEDTMDWKHASTRNIVIKADPLLERTVIVSTKFDTKLPQFGSTEDIEEFVESPILGKMFESILGGPFFTSVPSGRVGSNGNSAFSSNDAFLEAINQLEVEDIVQLESKVQPTKILDTSHIGISSLRQFLEQRVEECYRKNVTKIVPILQKELIKAENKLLKTERELTALSLDHLKASAEEFREKFVRALESLIHGSIQAPSELYGETLEMEQSNAGTLVDLDHLENTNFDRLLEVEIGSTHHKLYGGAQYHRLLREFAFAVKNLESPEITEDEISNAVGLGDLHDGVNFMRAACVIAIEKARLSFDPVLENLRLRTVHVMKRLFSVIEYMIKREGGIGMHQAHQKQFSFIVRRIYENFIEESVDDCLVRSRDDLKALTRFVMWDLHERSSDSVRRTLPDSHSVQIYALAVEHGRSYSGRRKENPENVLDQWEAANMGGISGSSHMADRRELMSLARLMEDAALSRTNSDKTGAIVSALVRHIMTSWRENFSKNVAMKFNCFFLMPFVDSFPFYLRSELEKVYSEEGELFDLKEAREELIKRREELINECKSCHQIQGKFDLINSQLNASYKGLDEGVN